MSKATGWQKSTRLDWVGTYTGLQMPEPLRGALLKLSGDTITALKTWAYNARAARDASKPVVVPAPAMTDEQLKAQALAKMTAVEMALTLVDQGKPWGAGKTLIELNPMQALEFFEKFQTYNSMKDLPVMCNAIAEAVPVAPHAVTHHYEVGNEGSLVVYVVLHRSEGGGTNWDLVASRVVLAGRNAGCQEVSAEPVNQLTLRQRIRLWWD